MNVKWGLLFGSNLACELVELCKLLKAGNVLTEYYINLGKELKNFKNRSNEIVRGLMDDLESIIEWYLKPPNYDYLPYIALGTQRPGAQLMQALPIQQVVASVRPGPINPLELQKLLEEQTKRIDEMINARLKEISESVEMDTNVKDSLMEAAKNFNVFNRALSTCLQQ